MADERTSLFANTRAGTSYALPGRFSRRKQTNSNRLQCCIWSSFLVVFVLALIIAIALVIQQSNDEEPADSSANDVPARVIDSDEFLTLMTALQWPLNDEQETGWALEEPDESQKQAAIESGIIALGNRELYEENLQTLPLNTPSYRHQRAVSTTADARQLSKRGYIENYATLNLAKQFSYEKPRGRHNIGKGPSTGLKENNNKRSRSNRENRETRCNFSSRYRDPTGACNSRQNPFTWGVAYTPFRRALNPDYADGISAPRTSNTKNPLPSARNVSLSVHRPSYSLDPHFTVMVAVFGQFLDHDVTATALTQGPNNEPIDCCTEEGELHEECFPVILSAGDPNYDRYNITCMNFIRSAPAPIDTFGPRQQLNQVSAFIDGSAIYGTTQQKVDQLRTFEGGELRMYVTQDNRTLLPVSTDPTDGCNEAEQNAKGRYCFETGDTRANENLHLTSMHLIWARHHNYVVNELAKINPEWNDEKLFQEGKRLVAAQLQHITYNEFLPILLGQRFADEIGLTSKKSSEANADTYNETVDASIANIFASCAFRFAHTLIPGVMNTSRDLTNPNTIELHKMLFNPYSLYLADGLDNAIGGAVSTTLARSDQYFSTELTEKLFMDPNDEVKPAVTQRNVCGLDLVSLNIQRGRDHGLPTYSEWRKHCRLPSTDTWADMAFAVDENSLESMKQIYKDASNVDVYTGALSEPPLEGSIIGPLLSCILTDQFMRLKRGDSHFYERKVGPQRFTNDQLGQIQTTTLAGVICRNSDNLESVQRFVMKNLGPDNQIENCRDIDTFSFEAWKEEPYRRQVAAVRTISQQSTIRAVLNN